MARRQFNRFRPSVTPSSRAWQRHRIPPQPGQVATPQQSASPPETDLHADAIAAEPARSDYPTDTSEATATAAEPTPSTTSSQAGWRWSLVWLSVVLVCSSTGIVAALWMTMLPPPPNCQQVSPLAADAERLYCAQQAAASGKVDSLIAGINLVKQWGPEHPLYNSAQTSLEEWSRPLLSLAEQKVADSQLEAAIELVNKIPPSSPLYQEAQDAIAAWKQNWEKGEGIYAKAQAALKTQKWQEAWTQAQALSNLDNPHWQQKANPLRQQIASEKLAWEQLQRARTVAQDNFADALVEAIALARKVTPKTYAQTQANQEIQNWSRKLLTLAAAQLQAKEFDEAIAIAERVPKDAKALPEAEDLIRLSRAYQAADVAPTSSQPLHEQLWNLFTALEVARQISPDRPLYKVAKAQIARWEMQRQDLVQLQFAQTLASINQVPGLKLAIAQAATVAPGRPQRLQAQTLIAHWRKEIQRLEDRPYLNQAQAIAKANTVPSLKSAIAVASQIAQGRALRIDAQTAIASWRQQIQIIEDQPFLDQARSLASQGSLNQAIAAASKIRSGRALYDEAQAAINDWVVQQQIAEDQPIMNEAYGLADRGSLSRAIEVASQIGYGRALYGEAQGAINQWAAEREAIRSAQEAADRQPVEQPANNNSEPNSPPPEEIPSDSVEPEPALSDPSLEAPSEPAEPAPPPFDG